MQHVSKTVISFLLLFNFTKLKQKKYFWFFIQDTVGRCASYLPPRLQVRVWFSNILILFYYSFFIWMCARKNSLRDHCIFKNSSFLIYDTTKSFTLTELIGYVLESWEFQLSNAHPVSSVLVKLFILLGLFLHEKGPISASSDTSTKIGTNAHWMMGNNIWRRAKLKSDWPPFFGGAKIGIWQEKSIFWLKG